jgi:hypothetical protein
MRRFGFSNFVSAIAPWLSIIIEISGDLMVSEDSISSRISRSQLICCAAYVAAIYLASQIDNTTTDYLMDFYIIGFSAHINKYFIINLSRLGRNPPIAYRSRIDVWIVKYRSRIDIGSIQNADA